MDTNLCFPPSSCPKAPSTMYPTQSTILTFKDTVSFIFISTPSAGTNFGSTVIIVLPEPLWGISSLVLSFLNSLSILGITNFSINFLIKVDFPVLTGPTTPIYISP